MCFLLWGFECFLFMMKKVVNLIVFFVHLDMFDGSMRWDFGEFQSVFEIRKRVF